MLEDSYRITGGVPLVGKVTLSGAKNVALKVLIASLLFEDDVIFENVPRIRDVEELLHLFTELGVEHEFRDNHTLVINSTNLKDMPIGLLHGSKIRVSFMLLAPLLTRFNEAKIPNPGGCRLGARSIDRIVEGTRALGALATYVDDTGYYELESKEPLGGEYTFAKSSHTGTETLLILAARQVGKKTTIKNAAQEPEIDSLIEFLNEAGAKIKRVENAIEIMGVAKLHQTKPFVIPADRNEAVTFACAALATGGDVTIHGLQRSSLQAFIEKVDEAGGGFEEKGETELRFYTKQELRAVRVTTGIHPGFMTDWQPNWAIVATQSSGETIIHETVLENRFAYVPELNKLGAHIDFTTVVVDNPEEAYQFAYNLQAEYANKLAIKIVGPVRLHEGVVQIADLRAGASLILAALAAHGTSIVSNAHIVERGYENLVEKFKALGAHIEKV